MRIFDTKVIVNMETIIENDIRTFLEQKSSYKDFKIEEMNTTSLGEPINNKALSKIMVVIVYSYLKEDHK